nr:sulfatase-like hydrolase/transferase [Sphingomonas sp. IC-56]
MYSDVDRHNPPPQILSISLESFGLAREPNRRAALIEPLIRELGGLYKVEQGAHDYFGATLQGEVRELCGERLFGNAAQDGVLRQLSQCLPSQLRRRGYDTVALHGNGGRFYSRWAVYPAMGFRQSFFYDDLAAADPAVTACPETAFNAACDERVYSRAIGLFDGQKRFVHVMTLDSHLPVLDAEPGSCSSIFAENSSLCGYAKLLQRSLAQLGLALHNAKVQPDVVFIYGDHAPPFASELARKVFSAEAVPYLILRKRNPDQDRQPSTANDAAARVVQ